MSCALAATNYKHVLKARENITKLWNKRACEGEYVYAEILWIPILHVDKRKEPFILLIKKEQVERALWAPAMDTLTKSSAVMGCPFLSLATTILPSRSFMSLRLSVRASTAMISLATAMSNCAWDDKSKGAGRLRGHVCRSRSSAIKFSQAVDHPWRAILKCTRFLSV